MQRQTGGAGTITDVEQAQQAQQAQQLPQCSLGGLERAVEQLIGEMEAMEEIPDRCGIRS
jgi:hypothetical protein